MPTQSVAQNAAQTVARTEQHWFRAVRLHSYQAYGHHLTERDRGPGWIQGICRSCGCSFLVTAEAGMYPGSSYHQDCR